MASPELSPPDPVRMRCWHCCRLRFAAGHDRRVAAARRVRSLVHTGVARRCRPLHRRHREAHGHRTFRQALRRQRLLGGPAETRRAARSRDPGARRARRAAAGAGVDADSRQLGPGRDSAGVQPRRRDRRLVCRDPGARSTDPGFPTAGAQLRPASRPRDGHPSRLCRAGSGAASSAAATIRRSRATSAGAPLRNWSCRMFRPREYLAAAAICASAASPNVTVASTPRSASTSTSGSTVWHIGGSSMRTPTPAIQKRGCAG